MTDVLDQTANMDELLDATLDDIADLPSFKPFPAGAHLVKASMALKDINGNKNIEVSLKMMATEELSDPSTPEEDLCKEGDETSSAYNISNEFAMGAFKAIAAPIQEALGVASIREIIEGCKDMELLVVTTVRFGKDDQGKKDPEKRYTNIKSVAVV